MLLLYYYIYILLFLITTLAELLWSPHHSAVREYINTDLGPTPIVLECCFTLFIQWPRMDKQT